MSRSITRRDLLKAGAASGALLLARPVEVLARPLRGAVGTAAARTSSLLPDTTLVHADLHNHTLLSDGDGDPASAFDSMRAAGLDVAALTDHATLGFGMPEGTCAGQDCEAIAGIDEASWARMRELADEANVDGAFVAIRGFEWSSPSLGHMNVWLSERWIDPLHTAGAGTGEGAAQFAHDEMSVPREVTEPLDALVRAAPTTGVGMAPFYDWLASPADRPGLGGGIDGIAGFNHPGREPGRFSYFAQQPAISDRVVSLEIFNRRSDYLFEGTDSGVPSPLNDCLNKGWRVGLLGVTDEHGTDWGTPVGKGRGGLWVRSPTREGVREAMLARRFFATRHQGLRFAATANGVPMGGTVPVGGGTVRFELDVARGAEWTGKCLRAQLLRPGTALPVIGDAFEFDVPAEGPVIFEAELSLEDGAWAVVRLTDPEAPADGRATPEYAAFGEAVAYASPFFLTPPS